MTDAKSGPVEVLDASIITQLTEGEIGVQVATARRYPRSIQGFKEELAGLATIDRETADDCFYELSRRTKGGGMKVIKGPSIRLAEMALYSWTNSRVDARVVEIGATHVTAQATFMDLERNIGVRIEKRRRITHTDGTRYNEDMINTTANAAVAVAYRDAVWKGIPKSHLREVEQQINAVILGTEKTLPKRRESAMEHFKGMGVEEGQILEHFNRKRVEDLTLEDVAHLRMYATGIKDGDTSIDTLFGEGEVAKGAKSTTDAESLDRVAADPKRKATKKADPAKEPAKDEGPPLEMETPADEGSPNAEQPPATDAEAGVDEDEGW